MVYFPVLIVAITAEMDTFAWQSMEQKGIRIDKWLWAARFFKTRSAASEAIKGGKVHFQSSRVKPSKEVRIGDQYNIRQGYSEITVTVLALSGKRGSATVAQQLYQETEQSIETRLRLQASKSSQPALRQRGSGRPTKRERRHIISFTHAKETSDK
jgi:ribosome-associated heat shock protein Hsp15